MEPLLEVRVLGECTIRLNGTVYSQLTRKQSALVAYLSINSGRVFRRDQLAELLWARSDPERARHSLSQAIYAVRRAPFGSALHTERDLMWIPKNCVTTDLGQLDVALHTRDVQAILSADTGAFMQGFGIPDSHPFDDWQEGVRAQLDMRVAAALESAAGAHEAAGEWTWVERIGEHLLQNSGLAVTVTEQYLRSLLAQGKTGAAEQLVTRLNTDREPQDPERLAHYADLVRTDRTLAEEPHAFIGRTTEIQVLLNLLAEADDGCSALALVQGEPGIGKTRLCTRFLRYAALRGARVFTARCYSGEGTIPYAPLARAILEAMTDQEKESVPQEWLKPLNVVLPGLGNQWHESVTDSASRPESRAHIYEAVAQLLSWLAKKRTLVLFLDDCQWASESTVSLTQYLLRRFSDRPFLVIAAQRYVWPIQASKRQLAHDQTSSIPLAVLSTDEAEALITACAVRRSIPLSTATRRRILELGGGQPLFIIELMRAVTASPGHHDVDLLNIPRSLDDLITIRLSELPGDALKVLEIASVFGSQITEQALRIAVRKPRRDYVTDIDMLIAHGVFHETERGLAFSHDVIREACYARMSSARRRFYHYSVAQALAKIGNVEDHAAIAKHYHLAGEKPRAFKHALRAAQQAQARGGSDEAQRNYRIALDSAPSRSARAKVEHKLGDLLIVSRLFRDARQHFDGLMLYYERTGDTRNQLRVEIALAYLKTKLGEGSHEAIPVLERLADRASELRDLSLEMSALKALTLAVENSGDMALAERLRERVRSSWITADDSDRRVEVLVYLVGLHALFGSAEDAADLVQEALRGGHSSTSPRARYYAAFAAGTGLLVSGDLSGADKQYAQALNLARHHHLWDVTSGALNNYAVLLVELGRYADALALIAEGERIARAAAAAGELGLILVNRGVALLESGRFEELPQIGSELLSLDDGSTSWWAHPTGIYLKGYERLHARDIVTAKECRNQLLRYLNGGRTTNDVSYAEIFIARVTEAEGQREIAARRLEKRITDYHTRDIFCRYRLELEWARLTMLLDRNAAIATAGRVRAHAADMGAVPLVGRADAILDRLQ